MPTPSRRRERLFVLNDPHALRISAALAMEIGLNESVVLLQLEFLISISDNVHEGRVWTYQSLNDMRERYFPFWGKSTIGRTIQSLVEKDLLIVGNFNRVGFDRTQWYALNEEGIARLESIRLGTTASQNETPTSQNGTWTSQPESSSSQSGTPIPETTSENTPERAFESSKGLTLVDNAQRYDEMRLAILPYAQDFARELRDQAPLASTVTRLVNMCRAGGVDLDTFIERMYQARAIAQERTPAIRNQGNGPGQKSKMAYWLAVLEDLLGQTSEGSRSTGD